MSSVLKWSLSLLLTALFVAPTSSKFLFIPLAIPEIRLWGTGHYGVHSSHLLL